MKNKISPLVKTNKEMFVGSEQYLPHNKDRMYFYTWWENGETDKTKLGKHFVFAGKNPVDGCFTRIRESMGVRKDKFDDGHAHVTMIQDVSPAAKKHKRFGKNEPFDNFVRPEIGDVHSGEVHNLDYKELNSRVYAYLKKQNAKLPRAGLAAWQYRVVSEVSSHEQPFTYLGDMCGRAGKTITTLAIARETDAPITAIMCYVLTSFKSFSNDISCFDQFKHMEIINCDDKKWFENMKTARMNNKQVVLFSSLCKGGKSIYSERDKRIKKLFKQDEKVFLVIDEADYGAYKTGQSDILSSNFRYGKDSLFLMTGTNSERAIGPWKIQYTTSVLYTDMLYEREKALAKK